MGIYKTADKKGRKRYTVSKQWPDGSRTRLTAPNFVSAKNCLTRIESSMLDGTWKDVKAELSGRISDFTVRAFSGRWLEEYCRPRLKPRSEERYVLSLKSVNQRLGHRQLKSLSREDVHAYIRVRIKEVSPATVNRDIAALKKMLSYARDCEVIPHHPLTGFGMLREPQKAISVISMEEYRSLIECARDDFKPFIVLLGETAIRKDEAIHLTWQNVDLRGRMLTLEHTKNSKVRQIPLSDLAVEYLEKSLRYVDPHVFISPRTGKAWVNPDKPMINARKKAGVKVTFHGLRAFRCTQWLAKGIDIRTVKELMGHADISTTMRYAAYLSDHAERLVRGVQRGEAS